MDTPDHDNLISSLRSLLENCFKDPDRFLVASTVARAQSHFQASKFKFWTSIVERCLGGALGGLIIVNGHRPAQSDVAWKANIGSTATSIWLRVRDIAMKLISVVSNHIKKYPRVGTMIVVVAGISIVVIDGKLAHTWWTKPCAPPIGYVPITQYDAKMLMAMYCSQDSSGYSLNDSEPDNSVLTCQVCLEAPPSIACNGCGNLILCLDHLQLYEQHFGSVCPLCRAVTTFLHLQLPTECNA